MIYMTFPGTVLLTLAILSFYHLVPGTYSPAPIFLPSFLQRRKDAFPRGIRSVG